MRVTKTLLKKLVDEKLKELEMPFTVTEIQKSRFRGHEYECGAWWWRAKLHHNEYGDGSPFMGYYLYSFIPFGEIEKWLNKGSSLLIKNTGLKSTPLLDELEITI